uniref:Serpentine receptor class gamma n=1 Tax=Strongyloides papillosus TaxID=174720 RepID=A0A0N5CIS0_STREA
MEIPIIDGIFLIFQIFGYILYIMLAICFVFKIINDSKRECDITSFLYHFIANSIFDIIQPLAIIVFQKSIHWKISIQFFLTSTWIKRVYSPICFISIVGLILGHLISVVNRYYALYHSITFKTFWTKKTCLRIIFLQYFIPIFIFSYSFFYEAKLVYVPSFDIYVFSLTGKEINIANNVIFVGIPVISAIITATLNIIIFRKYNQVIAKGSGKERSKRFLMLSYMVVTTICLIIFATEQLLRLYFSSINKNDGLVLISFTLYWIIPSLTILQPIMTLIMSKNLRDYFLSFYFKRFLGRNKQISSTFNLKTTAAVTKRNKF